MHILDELKYSIRHRWGTQLALLIAYILLIVFFSIASPVFLSFSNFMNILSYSSVIGVTAVAMCFGLISGSLDLSVGSTIALTGIVIAQVIPDIGTVPAILVGLCVGALCGAFNGFIVTKGKIIPLIATLGTMSVFRGFTYLLADGKSIMITQDSFKKIGRSYIGGAVPVTVLILVAAFIIGWIVLSKTNFGRTLYSVGGNSKASYLAGINIKKNRFITFIIIGIMASVSGLISTAQTGSGIPQAATGTELDIMAAVILGGTSLAGGKGSMAGTFIGLLILTTLSNGMVLLNIPSFWQMVAKGSVLIIAVYIDVIRGGGFERFEE